MIKQLFSHKKLIITLVVCAVILAVLAGLTLNMMSPASTTTPGGSQATNPASGSPPTSSTEPASTQSSPSASAPGSSATSGQETTSVSAQPPTTPSQPEPSSPPTPLTILSVTGGDVFVMRAGTSNWVPATTGMTLQPGDAVKTGDNSNAAITFFEGSTIELTGSTAISVAAIGISSTGSTTINLKQTLGKTISRVKKLTDQESEYEIETPAAVAAVRGSTMVVTVAEGGTTVVANESGDIRVIAQGVEVIIPVVMKSTVTTGGVPGVPEPINPPPSSTPPVGGGGGEPVLTAYITTRVQVDKSQVYIGDTITYTYFISNTGNLQIQSVSLTDDVAGIPVYQSGDNNANSHLDPGETWVYTAKHIASTGDPSPLINNATFSATVSATNILVAKEKAEVSILPKEIPLNITTASLFDGEVGAEYSQALSAIGGRSPYTWSIIRGTLPDGLELDSVTGSIMGTPTTAGISNFTIRVTDSIGGAVIKDLSITVNETLTIDTESLPDAKVGVEYSQTLVAANGTHPYTWSIIRGALPKGLKLDSVTGSITGTPTNAGISNFTIRVTDNLGVTVTKELTITVSNLK